jgi:hypothetical protein
MVSRLDRLARSTRDLLNTLATITDRKAGFRLLGDTWADTISAYGRLMLTVLGGLAEFERELIRTRRGQSVGCHLNNAKSEQSRNHLPRHMFGWSGHGSVAAALYLFPIGDLT